MSTYLVPLNINILLCQTLGYILSNLGLKSPKFRKMFIVDVILLIKFDRENQFPFFKPIVYSEYKKIIPLLTKIKPKPKLRITSSLSNHLGLRGK